MVLLLGGLIVIDLIVYIGVTSSTFTEQVAAARSNGYNRGYAETFPVGFQEAYGEAFNKGYNKAYEIGVTTRFTRGTGNRVELSNPTYSELKEFLVRDETNLNRYVHDEYICFHFAADLNNNAEAAGIRAAYVQIRAQNWAHAVTAFETSDRGLVFIEPQSDRNVELAIGEPYSWQQAGALPLASGNEPILEIQIIW